MSYFRDNTGQLEMLREVVNNGYCLGINPNPAKTIRMSLTAQEYDAPSSLIYLPAGHISRGAADLI
jgi:hypothetical protein